MKVWPTLKAHLEPGVVVFVFNSSAGARDWPASLAISELQVWREVPHLKLRWRFTRDYSPSSYHLPVVPQLGEGLCTPLSGPCWCFMWLKLGLVHVVSMAVSSYMQLPCCAPRTLFPCIHLLPLALRLFCHLFLSGPWALGGKEDHTSKST